MKKIPTLFKRDLDRPGHPIVPEYNDGTEWVLAGEGSPTRKYDGVCALVRDGKLYKRHEVKPGKIAPPDFEQVAIDAPYDHFPVDDVPDGVEREPTHALTTIVGAVEDDDAHHDDDQERRNEGKQNPGESRHRVSNHG